MPRNLDLALLRSFVAIADTGGVTRAATHLHLTQSAVSMQLKRLEEAMGETLIQRARNGMTLTGPGEQLYSYARRMLELNDEVWSRLTDRAYEGSLILGAPHDVVYPFVPDVLRRFARLYPRVAVTLQSSYTHQLKTAFANGEIDVILTTETEPDTGAEILQESPLVWIGAPGGTAWRRRPLPLAFENGCIFRAPVQRALDDAGIAWTMAVESLATRAVEASVSADLAVHCALDFTVPPHFEVIQHDGVLPSPGTTKVAMYVAQGSAGLSDKLGGMVREVWTAGQAPALVAAE